MCIRDSPLDPCAQRSWLVNCFRLLIAYKNVLNAVDNLSIANVYGFMYFGQGALAASTLGTYVRHDTLGHEFLTASQHFSAAINNLYDGYVTSFRGLDSLKVRYVPRTQ